MRTLPNTHQIAGSSSGRHHAISCRLSKHAVSGCQFFGTALKPLREAYVAALSPRSEDKNFPARRNWRGTPSPNSNFRLSPRCNFSNLSRLTEKNGHATRNIKRPSGGRQKACSACGRIWTRTRRRQLHCRSSPNVSGQRPGRTTRPSPHLLGLRQPAFVPKVASDGYANHRSRRTLA